MPQQGLGLRSVTAVRGPSPQTPLNKTSLRHEADVTRVAFNVRGIGPASALTGSYSWHFGGWNGISSTGWQREMIHFHLGRKGILQKKVKA